ncbi:MAG: PQQ-like beta-propeller repeat protein [Spirochaetales bacterium]|nr:PQQ-like beta-propeller repeat protein [Spirochaetales bacterium]
MKKKILYFIICLLFLLNCVSASSEQLWRFITGGRIRSYPAIAQDGTVYLLSDDRFLYSLTAKGEQKWRFFLEERLGDCFTIGQDSTLYIGYKSGELFALHGYGKKIWGFNTGQTIMYSPVQRRDGTLLLVTEEGTLFAISHTGILKWKYELDSAPSSSPVLDTDGTLYVPLKEGSLLALESWGEKKWQIPVTGAPTTPAIAQDGTIYIGTDKGLFYAISPLPKIRWTISGSSSFLSGVIGEDNTIYTPTRNGIVYAILPNGEIKWTVPLKGSIPGTCAVGENGTVYAGTNASIVYGIDPLGRIQWEIPIKGEITNIVLSPLKILYVGSSDWTLYAFEAEKPAKSPWPLYLHDARHSGRSARYYAFSTIESHYKDNFDFMYLKTLIQSGDPELIEEALNEIEDRINKNEVKASRQYIFYLLEKIAGFGITEDDFYTNYPFRGYSQLREKACVLYTEVGGLEASLLLLRVFKNEKDIRMRSVAMHCLGLLKSDPDGSISNMIAAALQTDAVVNSSSVSFAAQAVSTLKSIAEYQGALTRDGLRALLTIARGKYGAEAKTKAWEVLNILGKK